MSPDRRTNGEAISRRARFTNYWPCLENVPRGGFLERLRNHVSGHEQPHGSNEVCKLREACRN